MSAAGAGSHALRDGLVLMAPGGVFVPEANALVVADTHVGYTQELRARGYGVPAVHDHELIARVRTLLAMSGAARLVIAGDLVHGRASARGEPTGDSPLERFVHAVAPRAITVVLGNHDRHAHAALARLGLAAVTTERLGVHVVHHGDDVDTVRRERASARARNGRVIVGHLHPALTLDDGAGACATVPAFVCAAGLLCLPALSPWSRGGDVRSHALRAQLSALADDDEMGVAAAIGKRVVVVGNVFGPARTAPGVSNAKGTTTPKRTRRRPDARSR